MALTNQDKIDKILNHPNWTGDANEAQSLFVDITLSFEKEKKDTKKRQVYKKVVMNAEELTWKWKAPHIKALLKKVDIGVKYTKVNETREAIVSKMSDEVREAMKSVIEDIKKEESSGSYDVFAASKKANASKTESHSGGVEEQKESEPEGPRRTKLLEHGDLMDKVEKKKKVTSLTELKNKAKDLNIKNYSGMKKADLVSIIKSVENAVNDTVRLDLIKNVNDKNKMPTLKDLKAEAKKLKIKNFSKMKKGELEEAIKNLDVSKKGDEIDENGTETTNIVDEIVDDTIDEEDTFGDDVDDQNGTSVEDIEEDGMEDFEDFVEGVVQNEEDYPNILDEEEYD